MEVQYVFDVSICAVEILESQQIIRKVINVDVFDNETLEKAEKEKKAVFSSWYFILCLWNQKVIDSVMKNNVNKLLTSFSILIHMNKIQLP